MKTEPHEMTRFQFREHLVRTEGGQAIPRNIDEQLSQEAIHLDYILRAMEAGKKIPLKVIASLRVPTSLPGNRYINQALVDARKVSK